MVAEGAAEAVAAAFRQAAVATLAAAALPGGGDDEREHGSAEALAACAAARPAARVPAHPLLRLAAPRREKAVYPLTWVKDSKFWPSVGRVDNAHGDRNLICSCPPIESYANMELA